MRKSEILEVSARTKCAEGFVKFGNSTAKNIARKMAAEYESERRAWEALNTRHQKSGKIDANLLSSYRTTDDIFQRRTIKKEGQSHGLVVVIDWSCSMRHLLGKIAAQYLILALYCSYAKIPFEIYTFTSAAAPRGETVRETVVSHGANKNWSADNQTQYYDISFNKIASSDMSVSDLTEVYNHIVMLQTRFASEISADYKKYLASTLGELGYTPLIRSHIISYVKAKEFQRAKNIQNMNIVFITDGDDVDSDVVANTIVDPFSNREYSYATRNEKTYNYHCREVLLSTVNKMIRDSNIKICNIYIDRFETKTRSSKLENRCTGFIRTKRRSHENWDPNLDRAVVEKMAAELRKSDTFSINNFMYYNTFIVVNSTAFPSFADGEDNISSTDGALDYTRKNAIRDFHLSMANAKALGIVGSLVNNMLVKDFATGS